MAMKKKFLLFITVASFILSPVGILSSSEIIIIKSSDIIPYQKATEGFKKKFSPATFQEYSIDEDISQGKSILARAIKRGGDLILAVGPEAAYLVGTEASSISRVFTMVLSPERLLDTTLLYHGVSLNLPVSLQLERIKSAFPERKRIGVLYTQELNQNTVDSISDKALAAGLRIVGFPVASRKEISKVLKSPQLDIDILWIIPDRTIGSEKIIKYLIKKMLLRKIPVVGFNEWFAKNGAILSFSLDYQEIGKQAAELAQKLLLTGPSLAPFIQEPLKVKTIVNMKVAGKLGIAISVDLIKDASEVIK
jgi:putative ABC transport system substrate-binding protein